MNNTRERKIISGGQRRKELLEKSTSAEKAACAILAKLGMAYVRQFPIWTGRKKYFADIFIPELKLVLEIDGKYHFAEKQKRLDENRSAGIRRLGFHVCRLSNKDARSIEKVVSKIRRYLKK